MALLSRHPKGFTITEAKGYHMTFKNGITVSVQWGGGNHCHNYNRYNEYLWKQRILGRYHHNEPLPNLRCEDAEVSIWDQYRNYIVDEYRYWVVYNGYENMPVVEYTHESTASYDLSVMTPDETAKVLAWAAARPRSIRLFFVEGKLVSFRKFLDLWTTRKGEDYDWYDFQINTYLVGGRLIETRNGFTF